MGVRWNDVRYKQDYVIFDTMLEAIVWAESISADIFSGVFDGYTSPDEKVAMALAFMLAQKDDLIVHTKREIENNALVFKVWIIR